MALYYAIKRQGKYLQGIETNKKYCGTGCASTMGTRFNTSEFKTKWGTDKVVFEWLTAVNYLKILLQEYRWKDLKPFEIRIEPVEI